MMRFVVLIPALMLGACATAPPDPATPETRAQRLAALLVDTEASDPGRVDAAAPEMAALEAALAPAPPAVPAPPAPPAAPSLVDGRSVLSAVHVASYRDRDTAGRGWTLLSDRFGALAGRSARVQRVDLGERGVFLRLKAGPYDTPDAAEAACAEVRASGDWCAVTDFSGEAL
jgi:hypothetical protein